MKFEGVINELSKKAFRLKNKQALVGFDGFIDKIAVAVDQRYGTGLNFERFNTVSSFAERVREASSRNTNIEWYPLREKMGGNGPLLANALFESGVSVRYVGLLGEPINALFKELADKTKAVSLGQPGETHAIEFGDGKVLFGYTHPLEVVTYQRILEKVGEGIWLELLSQSDLLAFQNWTMLTNLTSILSELVQTVLPMLPPKENREWFFDLADPIKRPLLDLKILLNLLRNFQACGFVSLSMNRGEGEQIGKALALKMPDPEDKETFKFWLMEVQRTLGIGCVVFHWAKGACCVLKGNWFSSKAFPVEQIECLTGSGDHFNAGFLIGRLLEMEPEHALILGNAFAALYIRSGYCPALSSVDNFLKRIG